MESVVTVTGQLARFTEIMRHEWFTLGIHLGYRYEGSPIVVPDGTPAPPDDYANYVQTARPGHSSVTRPRTWLRCTYAVPGA